MIETKGEIRRSRLLFSVQQKLLRSFTEDLSAGEIAAGTGTIRTVIRESPRKAVGTANRLPIESGSRMRGPQTIGNPGSQDDTADLTSRRFRGQP